MSKVKALVAKLEKSKVTAQLFRVARLVAVGLVTAKVTGSAVDSVAVTAIVEAAFRQVFDPKAA